MGALEHRSRRTFAIWVVVLGTHVAVILLLGQSRPVLIHVEDIARVDLFLIPPPEESRQESPARESAAAHAGISTRAVAQSPAAAVSPAVPAAVDWNAAAKFAAGRALEDRTDAGKVFGEIVASPYRDCQLKKRSWRWIPERKKSGFAGGLPWVQVSERCIVGLGFFGCAIGELPPPRGDLLDDMDTANQMQSTVPGSEDCVEEPPPSE